MSREHIGPNEDAIRATEAEEREAQENREITARTIEEIMSRSSVPSDDDIDEDLMM